MWAYEQGRAIRKSKPANEAHQRDFYSFVDEHGQLRDLEQHLSQLESVLAPLFPAIEGGYHKFHPDDWYGLAFFIALLWLRGPAGIDFLNELSARTMKSIVKERAMDEEEFKKQYEEFLKSSGTKTKLSAEEMRAFLLRDDWKVEQTSHG